MGRFNFGKDFLFGTASSSVQIEGGDKNNTWYNWCGEGHIADSSTCYTACDHWNRVEEDTDLLVSLGVGTYRMSFEWSRIQPSPEHIDEEALSHYRHELKLLCGYGIRPLVTIHHFSEPQWFMDKGGWAVHGNSEYFIRFAKLCVERFGDLVSDWVTFNEPNVYSTMGYFTGIFPPGKRSLRLTLRVRSEMISCHVRLYSMIHEIRKEKGFEGQTKVGFAMHIRIFDSFTTVGKIIARIVDYAFNTMFMEGMTCGKLCFPLPKRGCSCCCGKYADFIGINYYTRNIVEFVLDPRSLFYRYITDMTLDKNDLGWDIYPEGIYRVCRRYYDKYSLPIYITENGICDRHDNRREKYITDHLSMLARAIDDGIKIERYYYWTLYDNFEWLEGESAPFGLYKCDFNTMERIPRPSTSEYKRICRQKEIDFE
ncbi:MAG: glycoside hydrolase family 1 protein [Eubacteriales bacterium]